MRAVTYNAGRVQDRTHRPGQRDSLYANVMRLLEATSRPEVVCLQEVWGWGERIPGYQRVQAPRDRFRHPEARSTQLLVRREGLRLRGEGARQADGPWWVGPKHGLDHPPRVFPRASVEEEEHPGPVWDFIGVHRTRRPWSPGGRAYEGEERTLIEWGRDRPHGPLVLLGDHNHRADDLAHLAEALDGTWHLRGIDGFLVVRAVTLGRHRVPGEFGGDGHRPVVGRFVARPE